MEELGKLSGTISRRFRPRGVGGLMCAGCEDWLEWASAADAVIMERLPELLSRPLDHDVLMGRPRN
jgi:hypothetical protein